MLQRRHHCKLHFILALVPWCLVERASWTASLPFRYDLCFQAELIFYFPYRIMRHPFGVGKKQKRKRQKDTLNGGLPIIWLPLTILRMLHTVWITRCLQLGRVQRHCLNFRDPRVEIFNTSVLPSIHGNIGTPQWILPVWARYTNDSFCLKFANLPPTSPWTRSLSTVIGLPIRLWTQIHLERSEE